MLEMKYLKDAEMIKKIKESERKRYRDEKKVDGLVEAFRTMQKMKYEYDCVIGEAKEARRSIGIIKKEGREDSQKKIEGLIARVRTQEEKAEELWNRHEMQAKLVKERYKEIANIIDEEVFVSQTEEDNPVVRTHGEVERKALLFDEICTKIGGVDMEIGAKIAGHRGYFMLGKLALLSNALQAYAIDFLVEYGYQLVKPPVFMNMEMMEKTAQLSDFDEQLYNIAGTPNYLIATSEQPLSTFYYKKVISPDDLPIKFCGQSPCFRKEAGAHGKDNKGIFRVHYFEKIEQFVLCSPEKSKEIFHVMVELAEEFLKSLGISYRVVSIVSGELNNAAAVKYDIEGYFSGTGKYRELMSISNCTNYQSTELETYVAQQGTKEKRYVHMLNGTLCAIQRTLCCLIEQMQSSYGIAVPKPLQKYVNFDFIEYTM